MSDLGLMEKKKLERALNMSGGYVLNFTNRTFEDFIAESVGIEIYCQPYDDMTSGSKANYMRAFWKHENNYVTIFSFIFAIWIWFKSDVKIRELTRILRAIHDISGSAIWESQTISIESKEIQLRQWGLCQAYENLQDNL